MRIVSVVHQFYPEYGAGTEKFLLNLASMLQKAGHTAEVVTYTFGNRDLKTAGKLNIREYAYRGIGITAVRHSAIPAEINRLTKDADIHAFALGLLRRKAPDVVHMAHPMRLTSFADAAQEYGIPYVMTLTDFWTLCPKVILQTSSGDLCSGPEGGEACSRLCPELDGTVVRERLQRNAQLLENAAALVAPSNFVASVVKKAFPALDIQIIPHGMELHHLKPNRHRYAMGDAVVFAYCGSLVPHKGAHTLISAFRGLRSDRVTLRLYGTAPDAGYLATLKKLTGDDRRVQFCGAYNEGEVAEVFQDIDVLVIPSLCYESYSMVLQEAWGCSVPVIASRLGSLGEKVQDGVTGFTFSAGDHRELADKLCRVVERPELLNEIKEHVRTQVPPLVEEEAHRYERIYNCVLAAKTAAPVAARVSSSAVIAARGHQPEPVKRPLRVRMVDAVGAVLTPAAAALAAVQTRYGPRLLPATFKAWDKLGVLPMRYHYHQPAIHPAELPERTWTSADPLYGINMRPSCQLELLGALRYGDELKRIPLDGDPSVFPPRFFYNNGAFGAGDAEILYSMIRHLKPARMIEVGCGWSSLIAKLAFEQNRREGHAGQHICIEPYENAWLESLGFDQVIRKRVEELELSFFEPLGANDILFIDSSHVVRIGGDVFYEFLHILPNLQPGVFAHIHDIFLPFEYPKEWVQVDRRFWTEQYLLQAFLAFNTAYEVVLGLQYLSTCHTEQFAQACPIFGQTPDAYPGSFWIRRSSGAASAER